VATRARVSILTLAAVLAACSSGEDDAATGGGLPAGGLYATIAVGSRTFHASITHPDGMAQARAVWDGTSNANIPAGRLDCSAVSWNEPWHWHLEPETVRFAEVTMELCDGDPSYVEANCATFGGGSYCPWAAEMTALRDCSTDPACPAVPR